MNLPHRLTELFFPRKCPVCGRRLEKSEVICLYCMSTLPRTSFHLQADNALAYRFYGSIKVEQAAGYFFYDKTSPYRNILYELKYKGNTRIGKEMGRQMATYISSSEKGFFKQIDAIIPVPLSKKRLHKRGYNQSECLAEGISQVTGIPVYTWALEREIDNPSQTNRNDFSERWKNVEGIFQATPQAIRLQEKHLLLVDDVITTGATLIACGKAIKRACPDCRISILVLGITKNFG